MAVDNGGDELTKALQAQTTLVSSQSSRASRSQRKSCFMRRAEQCKRLESGRCANVRAGQY